MRALHSLRSLFVPIAPAQDGYYLRMRVSVLAIQKARFCALILNESFVPCDVVTKSVCTRLEYLAKVNVSDVCLVDYTICLTHPGTLVEKDAPLVSVPSLLPDP